MTRPKHTIVKENNGSILGLSIAGVLLGIGVFQLGVIWTIVVLMIDGALIFYLSTRITKMELYDEMAILRKGGDSFQLPYSAIVEVKLTMATIRGGNKVDIKYCYKREHTVTFLYVGYVPKEQLDFLRSKGVVVSSVG